MFCICNYNDNYCQDEDFTRKLQIVITKIFSQVCNCFYEFLYYGNGNCHVMTSMELRKKLKAIKRIMTIYYLASPSGINGSCMDLSQLHIGDVRVSWREGIQPEVASWKHVSVYMDIASFWTKEAFTLVLTLVISMVQSCLPHMYTYTSQLLALNQKSFITLVLTFVILMVQSCSHMHACVYKPMCRIAIYITIQIQYACMAN